MKLPTPVPVVNAAAALDDWTPDDAARLEALMVHTAAAQTAYQIQMDDRIPVLDWIERYLS